jgi:RNA polymerase sigma-70 factor (ECF subfamily)
MEGVRAPALVTKQVCHQCVELDGFFNGRSRDPLDGTARNLDARLAILKETREAALGPWHRRMLRLVDEVLDGGARAPGTARPESE